MMTPLNYHDVPVSDEIKTFIADWLPYQNEGPAMEIHSEIERMLPSATNPFEYGLLTHLETTIGFLYEFSDGIEYDGESYTPGLDGSDDGGLERHVEMITTQSMQRHINNLNELVAIQRPNRLFP